tara:strand:+ start:4726 stop:5142 length:417 start_codon:yes stop_codon:yes gene_type:complete
MRFAGMALDGGNYVNAAQNAGGAMEAILAKTTPNYGALSNTASAAQSAERVSGMNAAAKLQNAGINSLANTKASAFGADAIRAQGEAEADAARSQGMSNMIGDIGGGLLGAFKPKTQTTSFGSLGPSNFDLNKNFWLK